MPETKDQTRTLPQGGLTDTERIEDILGTVSQEGETNE